jgi:hypothetical protein
VPSDIEYFHSEDEWRRGRGARAALRGGGGVGERKEFGNGARAGAMALPLEGPEDGGSKEVARAGDVDEGDEERGGADGGAGEKGGDEGGESFTV